MQLIFLPVTVKVKRSCCVFLIKGRLMVEFYHFNELLVFLNGIAIIDDSYMLNVYICLSNS